MVEQFLAALLLGITLVVWSILLVRRQPGQAWVAYEPSGPVPWGLVDVLLAIGLLIVFSSLALAAVGRGARELSGGDVATWEPGLQTLAIYAQAAVSLAVVAVSALTILARHRGAGRQLGWAAGKVAADVRLGVLAFLALAPPVYLLQLVLVTYFESHHPLVEMLRTNPQPHLIAACLVSAVLVAPVAEEYFFRGLLQGWLERLATGRDSSRELVLGGRRDAVDIERPNAFLTPDMISTDSDDPALRASPVQDVAESGCESESSTGTAYWPIVTSALIFAVLHLSHGPDWIPLFFLALGLGYIYRQTHRLLPSIVVHFLLNACSMAMFLVDIFV
ncbi:MAG: CPBP family intramembrane glutamic endopeptidase [Pirellulaceae bacterium]